MASPLAWMATAVGYRRAGKPELAAAAALVALAQAGSSAWFAAAPIAIAAWLAFSLALPDLRPARCCSRCTCCSGCRLR